MYRYHVFLSHNGALERWTGKLAESLRKSGLRVSFDDDSIELGEDIPAAIEDALRRSRRASVALPGYQPPGPVPDATSLVGRISAQIDDEEDRLSQAVVALGVLLPCLFVAYGVGLLKP